MATLERVRVAMTGFPGAPGVMTFHCLSAASFVDPLQAWLTSVGNRMPADVVMAVEASGDIFESSTGEISGLWAHTAPATVTGSVTGGYAAPVGFQVQWLTSVHLSGRLLRGRTFLVPAAETIFQNDGSIDETILTDIRYQAGVFVAATAGNFAVWQRPRNARAADGSRPAVTHRDGGHGIVASSRCPDKAVVLRSRRD